MSESLEKISFSSRLQEAQRLLSTLQLDGWLLYDFHGNNPLAGEFLSIPKEMLLMRRFFYWIPVKGEPVKIVHRIEASALDHLPGKKVLYASWREHQEALEQICQGVKRVAMEYSPGNALPYVSKVDAGTIESVRKHGVEVVSSAELLLPLTGLIDQEQLHTHFVAEKTLENVAQAAFEFIKDNLANSITEYDVQQWMLEEIARHGCVTNHAPICAVNANSANPHYSAVQGQSLVIREGDWVLLDLWCKQSTARAVYADITRVGVLAAQPASKQKNIFKIVKAARQRAFDLLQERFSAHEKVSGCEVDDACRQVIVEAGYGEFFTHRTGHSIDTELHGSGTHIDGFETLDQRPLLPGALFSIEPGIYLPDEFGVRLECDVFIPPQAGAKPFPTGLIQEEIIILK